MAPSSGSPTGGQRRNRVAPLPRGGYVTLSLIVLIQHILIMFFSSSYYHILPISLPTEIYVLSLSKKKILTKMKIKTNQPKTPNKAKNVKNKYIKRIKKVPNRQTIREFILCQLLLGMGPAPNYTSIHYIYPATHSWRK